MATVSGVAIVQPDGTYSLALLDDGTLEGPFERALTLAAGAGIATETA